MKHSLPLLSAWTVLSGMAGLSAQEPAPISVEDFSVAGMSAETDSAAIRSILGAPDSTVAHENPFDVGGRLPTWYYPELVVSFGYAPTPVGFLITGTGYQTHRGLRVGDAAERARRLYGEPEFARDDLLMFTDPADPEGLHVIRLELADAIVRRIYVGWLLD